MRVQSRASPNPEARALYMHCQVCYRLLLGFIMLSHPLCQVDPGQRRRMVRDCQLFFSGHNCQVERLCPNLLRCLIMGCGKVCI